MVIQNYDQLTSSIIQYKNNKHKIYMLLKYNYEALNILCYIYKTKECVYNGKCKIKGWKSVDK